MFGVQCNTMQYNVIQYNTMQYNVIQCNTMQYNAMCQEGNIMGLQRYHYLTRRVANPSAEVRKQGRKSSKLRIDLF